ncbi:MAG: TetR/AcrR family transcriptional regulator [Candidatus Binatia bacterium]
MKKATALSAVALDGRFRRGERSREAIVNALMQLIGGGVLRPTAQQVADEAGVGIRSVFRHFSEMESLYAAMDARIEGDAVQILRGGVRRGRRDARIVGLVRQRVALFERVAPYKRSANLQRWRSRFLQGRHQRLQQGLHDDLLDWLPELAGAPADLVEAFELALSFEAWDVLRADRTLSSRRATAVIERTVRALAGALEPTTRRRA